MFQSSAFTSRKERTKRASPVTYFGHRAFVWRGSSHAKPLYPAESIRYQAPPMNHSFQGAPKQYTPNFLIPAYDVGNEFPEVDPPWQQVRWCSTLISKKTLSCSRWLPAPSLPTARRSARPR